MVQLSQSWTGYLLSGAMAVVLSWALGGCRFGNKVERDLSNLDTITGYYQAQPQSLRFCVTTASGTTCDDAQTNLIPGTVANSVGNPSGFQVDNLETGYALIFDPFGQGEALPIFVDPADLSLAYLGQTAESILWTDSNCTTTLYVEETGQLFQEALPDSQGLPLSGRMSLNVEIFSTYDGDCTADLTEIAACYDDEEDCGGVDAEENSLLQEIVQAVYSPYIQAGVLTVGDLPDVTAVGYQVSYE